MKRGFLLPDKDDDADAKARMASLGSIINSNPGFTLSELKTPKLYTNPLWLGRNLPAEELEPQYAASSNTENSIEDPWPHNAASSNKEEQAVSQHSEPAIQPGGWVERRARCSQLKSEMDNTLALAAAAAYLGGPSFLAGYADEQSPETRGPSETASKPGDKLEEGAVGENPDPAASKPGDKLAEGLAGENPGLASKSGEVASTVSTDGFGHTETLSVPRTFRITSRRVYGRVLSLHGIQGLNEENMPSAPYAMIGAAVNIPKSGAPEGSEVSAPLLVIAPLANLGRRPDRDGGLAQPMLDIAVGQCVVGTLEILDAREGHTRYGYIEWTPTSPLEWTVDAPKSFYTLEHSLTTDLFLWSICAYDDRILLPQVPNDAHLIAFASRHN